MVEVADKPILVWQIEWLKSHGIENFVITVSYKHEVIEEAIKDGKALGVNVDYSIEENPLGRGGAIKQAFKSSLLKDAENVIVTNGDIITKFDLSKMINKHQSKDALVSMLVVPLVSRFGIVNIDDSEHITGFEEKPKLPYWINGGIYVFNKKIEPMLPEVGDHEKLTFPKITSKEFIAFKDNSFWRAVDVVKDRSEAEAFLEDGKTDFS